LNLRRANCYHRLNDLKRSTNELNKCRDQIQRMTCLNTSKRSLINQEIDRLSKQIEQENEPNYRTKQQSIVMSHHKLDYCSTECVCHTVKAQTIDRSSRRLLPESVASSLFNGRHEYLHCTSSAVELAFSDDKGRHLIANQDIPCDELLICERPYACLLLPDFVFTHCDSWSVIVIQWTNMFCSTLEYNR
jgi:hypothetical protein